MQAIEPFYINNFSAAVEAVRNNDEETMKRIDRELNSLGEFIWYCSNCCEYVTNFTGACDECGDGWLWC